MSNWESTQSLLASAVQTATGYGSAVNLGPRDRLLRQSLNVTAMGGSSPTLTARVEASPDGIVGWKTFATFAPVNSAASEKQSLVAPERYVRVAWLIHGSSPQVTFELVGTRGICFANYDQFEAHGLHAAATSTVSSTKKADALAAATEKASGILAARYDLPIEAWGSDLAEETCKLAAYTILSVRGFNPEGADKNVRDRYDDAMKWLTDVANGKVNPVGLIDQSPIEDETGVEIASYPARLWC